MEKLKMPPQQFWDNCSSLIKNMNDHIIRLAAELKEYEEKLNSSISEAKKSLDQVEELKKQISESSKKYITVNPGRKEMFLAGLTLGKNMKSV